jgi:hypothetical protein
MSDQGDTTEATPASEIQVPKHRLDELIQDKRQLQAQVNSLTEMVNAVQRRQEPQQPKRSPKELEALKERDPDAYKLFIDQERRFNDLAHKQKETSAGFFQMHEKQDAETLVKAAGLEEANKYATRIEPQLAQLRERGIHHMSRLDLYKLIKGEEALRSQNAPAKKETQPVKSVQPANDTDAPGSDPSQLGGVTSAASTPSGESLEDLEKRLENQVF